MSKHTLKVTCYIAIVFFLFLQFVNVDPLNSISYAVSIAVFLDVLYDRYFWRFNPIEKTPRLYGVYNEVSYSSYNNGYIYTAKVTIRQTLSSITILEEIEDTGYAESITAALVQSSSDGIWKLYYTYRTHPTISKHDDMHEGTVVLYIKNKNELNGIYFTNRLTPTQGKIQLLKR